jgi:hypothetical protein
MPCSWLSLDAMDISGEMHLDVVSCRTCVETLQDLWGPALCSNSNAACQHPVAGCIPHAGPQHGRTTHHVVCLLLQF